MPVQTVAMTIWTRNGREFGGLGKIIALPGLPEINHDGEHRSRVQHDEQHRHFRTGRIQFHEFFRDDDVRGTGNGKQFARALNQRENQDLKIIRHKEETLPDYRGQQTPSSRPNGFPSPPRVSCPILDVRFAHRGPQEKKKSSQRWKTPAIL
jgi:hypothetical protein